MIVFYRIERFPALFSRRFFCRMWSFCALQRWKLLIPLVPAFFFSYPPILILFFLVLVYGLPLQVDSTHRVRWPGLICLGHILPLAPFFPIKVLLPRARAFICFSKL